jgi:Ca2+-binding RTX toxin-like protein
LALLVAAVALVATASASAVTGLPRTYDSIPIDTPNPIGGGSFGWGIASADLTGAGYADLLVAQAQTGPGQVFAYDGKTGALLHTVYGYPYIINPPEPNPDGSFPTLAFVYIETMPSVGSCPQEAGLPTPQPGVMCPDPTVGPPDGIPSIVVGARNEQVATPTTDPLTGQPATYFPHIGRTYILDGLTGAVIQRIDMPLADRKLEADLAATPAAATILAANAAATPPITTPTAAQDAQVTTAAAGPSPQFSRVSSSLQGMPPCAGSNADNNAVGVGACPSVPRSVQIGDVTGDGSPDIITTARSFVEQAGPSTPTGTNAAGTALAGSQCASAAVAGAFGTSGHTCSGGRAWVYDTNGIVGSDPQHIIDTPLYTIKNPDAQTQGSTEFGGNVYRVGDAVGGTGNVPDGIPDFVITSRNADYPLKNPDPTMVDVGVGYLYSGACTSVTKCTPGSGATDQPVVTYPDPTPQPKAQFSSTFNGGRAVGYLNGSSIPDIVLPSALQSTYATADGAAFLFNGDLNAGGGGEASWHFATLTDPSPHVGGNFGSSFSGIGNPTDPANPYDDDLILGSFSPFDPATPLTLHNINNLYIMNPLSNTLLQTIPDPEPVAQAQASGFGVGLVPMGDLTGDGFLSYGASAYLYNGTVAGQGRAYILRADNSASPLLGPTPPSNPVPLVHLPPAPVPYKHGKCANTIIARAANAKVIAPVAPRSVGFKIFGFGRNEVIVGGAGDDCIKASLGNDKLYAGKGNDTIIGGPGNDLIFGGPGSDRLFGEGGKNQIYAGTGNTLLVGGAGSNLLVGGPGKDQLFGGRGHDVLLAGRGQSYLDGGKGTNVILARNGKHNVVNCGSARTVAFVDHGDKVINCRHAVYSKVHLAHASALVRQAVSRLRAGLRTARGPHPPRPK